MKNFEENPNIISYQKYFEIFLEDILTNFLRIEIKVY